MGSLRSEIHILGTGVLAEEFFSLALDAGIVVGGFVENQDRAKAGTTLCDRPILWVDDVPRGIECVCALSTTKRKHFIAQLAERVRFTTLVHPSLIQLPGTELGEGSIVSTGVLIASHTKIGKHVFINRGARIGHHTRVADFATIQPGANIAGLVEIGTEAYVGMGAIIIERLKIGRGATIAAGAVVTKDVPDHVLVTGNPAIVKKTGIDAR